MATGQRTEMRHRQPARWGRNLTILLLVVAVALTAWFWTRMRATALVHAAYAAQTGCLCRYTAGRDIDACAVDPGVARDWVSLGEDAGARSVIATVPLLARQTARWTPTQGCALEPWRD